MPGLSNNDIARGSGYELDKGSPVNTAANLKQRIALVAEMNHANQTTPLTPVQVTSRQQVAALAGWGSPADIMARIYFPANGGGLNGVDVWLYPLVESGGATANVQTVTVTGTATANVTHTILIGGRSFLEGGSYNLNILTGDTPTAIATKLKNVINAVLGCPFTGANTAGVATLTANWRGLSSELLTINILTNGNAAGVAYAVAESAAGSGVPDVNPALALFGNDWNTVVTFSIPLSDTGTNTKINTFNGNANSKTGRYDPLIMKPAIYIAGNVVDSTTSSADTAITDAMKTEMSIASASAPNSLGLPMEAAANYAVNFCNVANNTPNIDMQNVPLPDMPGPLPGSALPTQSNSYSVRNAILAMGMTTVIYSDNQYYPQDFATSYHPVGETPPVFAYPRDIMIDLNIRYKFTNLQKAVIENKQIAGDSDQVNAPNVVKPKDVKAALVGFANDLVAQGLITDAKFMIKSITVIINPTNKNRFDIAFSYNRSGVVRVISNVATVY
jgi:phage tail sheath gpL-like